MPWLPFTTADVLAEFNDSEKSQYDAAKNSDDLARIVGSVVNELTEAIRGRGIALGLAGTIPSGFFPPAIARARWNFLNAIPTGSGLLTDPRKAANQEYVDLLKLIRTDKKFYIEPGDGSFPVVMPAVKIPCRRFTTRDQEGL